MHTVDLCLLSLVLVSDATPTSQSLTELFVHLSACTVHKLQNHDLVLALLYTNQDQLSLSNRPKITLRHLITLGLTYSCPARSKFRIYHILKLDQLLQIINKCIKYIFSSSYAVLDNFTDLNGSISTTGILIDSAQRKYNSFKVSPTGCRAPQTPSVLSGWKILKANWSLAEWQWKKIGCHMLWGQIWTMARVLRRNQRRSALFNIKTRAQWIPQDQHF